MEPPCQLEYSCQPGDLRLYNEIECRSDGLYDKQAICLSKKNVNLKNDFSDLIIIKICLCHFFLSKKGMLSGRRNIRNQN